MSNRREEPATGVGTVVLAYAAFTALWIVLSDAALSLWFTDPATLVRASVVKGWVYVVVTSALLYLLLRRLTRALGASHERELALEREHQQPPAMLQAIAEASDDAIFAKDEQGRYLLCNNAAARYIGRPGTEVLGQDDRAFFPPEQAATLMALDRQARTTGRHEVTEELLDTPMGQRVFLATKGPLRAADGSILGTYGISRDITERREADRQLHESREHLRLLIDHAPVALAMFDRDMRYLEASRRWRDEYAPGQGPLIGRLHHDVLPTLPEHWKAAHRRGLAGAPTAVDEDRYERADGSVQWLRWVVLPWHQHDGTVGGIVIFSEDITVRKVAEDEMRQRTAELERFNRAAIQRELRMVALKREVNALARAAGRPEPYDTAYADAPDAPPLP